MLNLTAAAHTDAGPRPANQDRTLAEIENFGSDMCGLFCVADGMGGLADGQLAAAIAVDAVEQWWFESLPHIIEQGADTSIVLPELTSLLLSINEDIISHSQNTGAKLGTTCSLLLIFKNHYYVAHTGDSRIYIIRKQVFRKSKVEQLTVDHTWATDQLKLGHLSAEEIENNRNKNRLTSCLGVYDNPLIFTCLGSVARGDAFVICSDGLYRAINEKELAVTSRRKIDSDVLAKEMIEAAIRRGTTDNASVIVVKARKVN